MKHINLISANGSVHTPPCNSQAISRNSCGSIAVVETTVRHQLFSSLRGRIKVGLFLLLIVLHAPAWGTTHTLNPGTDQLGAIMNSLADGDVIVFNGDAFTETATRTFNTAVTLQAAAGAHPVLNCAGYLKTMKSITVDGLIINSTATDFVFHLNGGSTVDVIFRNSTINMTSTGNTIYPATLLHKFSIDNCVITTKGQQGLRIQQNIQETSITNTTIQGATYTAIYLSGAAARLTTINHCTFYNNPSTSSYVIYAKDFNTSQLTISNCVMYNLSTGSYASIYGQSGNNATVTNCMIYNCGDTYNTTNTNLSTANPMIYTENGDYFYQNGSPIIGAATDGTNLGDPRWHSSTPPTTYSITYDCDGATSGCPEDVASATNLPDPLPSAPVKTGYTFDGWFTNSDKTVEAVPGAALTDNITLYAKWTEIPHRTITLDPNGGTLALVDGWTQNDKGELQAEVYNNAPLTLPNCSIVSRNGYSVVTTGWFDNPNNGGTAYTEIPYSSPVSTLYPHWTLSVTLEASPEGYGSISPATISPVPDGASISADGATLTIGDQNFTATPTEATAEYTYAFSNWSWTPEGSTITAATTATASFTRTKNKYTVTFDANGHGTAPTAITDVEHGATITAPAAPTATGYTFDGWYKEQSCTNAWDFDNDQVTGTTTLYANWTAKTTTITLDKEDGEGGSDNVTATYGSAMPSANMPTRTGYTFGGFYDGDNGTGTQYYNADGTSAMNWDKETAAATLYAKWTPTTYTITYEDTYDVAHNNPASYTIESETITFVAPTGTRAGYTFAGWSPVSIEKGSTGNKTVTASWTAIPVSSITLDPTSLTKTVGDAAVTLTATVSPNDALDNTITWSSSDATVASVTNAGVVSFLKAGSATITATAHDGSGKSATCSVTVNAVSVESVSLNKTTTSISAGSSEKLTATILPANATNKNVTWSSDNNKVTVNNGLVSVASDATVGSTATITVTTEDGGKTATCTVTVTAVVHERTIPTNLTSLNATNYTAGVTTGDLRTWDGEQSLYIGGNKYAGWQVYIVPDVYIMTTKYGVTAYGRHMVFEIIDVSTGNVVATQDRGKLSDGKIVINESIAWDLTDLDPDKEYIVRARDGWNDTSSSLHITYMEWATAVTHDVIFDANGGTGTMNPGKGAVGYEYVIPKCTFYAPASNVFDKWTSDNVITIIDGKFEMPDEDVTLTANWKPIQFAKSIDFMKSDTQAVDVATVLSRNNYTMTPFYDTQWDNAQWSYSGGDCGLKSERNDREFSFWVPANSKVTIQLGTWQGNYEGGNKPELYANGVKLTDLKTSQQSNDPIITTEITEFVIKIVNPYWSLIQKIDIVALPYTISFDANSGEGTMEDVKNVTSKTYTLPECGFTAPAGKEFDAWLCSADGITYAVGDICQMPGCNVTFTAQWKNQCVAPEITTQPTLQQAELGGEITYTVAATGEDNAYQWYVADNKSGLNKTDIDGATEDSYTFTADATGIKYYGCQVTADCGKSIFSDFAGCIVTPKDFLVQYTVGTENDTEYTIETFTQSKEVGDDVQAEYITNLTNWAFNSTSLSGTGLAGTMSPEITTNQEDGNISFTFDVAENQQIQLKDVNMLVIPTAAATFEIKISDEHGHTYTKPTNVSSTAALTQIGAAISEETKFVGTITVQLSATGTYRLAKISTVSGTITSLPAPDLAWTTAPADGIAGGNSTILASSTDMPSAPVTYTSSNTDVATVTGNVISYIAEGSTTISAHIDGDGINFHSDGTTITKEISVLAANYTITFHNNLTPDVTKTQTVPTQEETALTAFATLGFSRSGYNFIGWAETATTAATIADQATITISADKDLYAVWSAEPYVPSVTDLAVTGTDNNVTLTWNLPGVVDMSNYGAPIYDTYAGGNNVSLSEGTMTVKYSVIQYGNTGVAFNVNNIQNLKTLTFSYTGSTNTNHNLWIGACDNVPFTDNYGVHHNGHAYWESGKFISASASLKTVTYSPNHIYYNAGNKDVSSATISQIAIYANSDNEGTTSGSFTISNVRYSCAGWRDLTNIIVLRKLGSAATSATDAGATKLSYTSLTSSYEDDLQGQPVGTYYYTVFAEAVDNGTSYYSVGSTVSYEYNPTNTFNGTTDDKWNDASNWSAGIVPTKEQDAIIAANCSIPAGIHAAAKSIKIDQTKSASIDIASTASLQVEGTITRDDSNPTEVSDLIVRSDATGTGALIFNNKAGNAKATVEMYSKANIVDKTKNWQYIGTPFSDVNNAAINYYMSYLYEWNAAGQTWKTVKNQAPMTPFAGYCISQDNAMTYHMTGTLAATGEQQISLATGDNVIGNSWTAPINIEQFDEKDFEGANITKTIYMFNTGVDKDKKGGEGTTAGTYVAIPIDFAKYDGDLKVIPAMAGFFISSTAPAIFTLNYDRLVRTDNTPSTHPMLAPARKAVANDDPTIIKLTVSGEKFADKLYIAEREDFSQAFDNGWDAEKWPNDAYAPELYAVTSAGNQAVASIPQIDGTLIGFRSGAESVYTISFKYDGDATYYLNDIQEQRSTLISNDQTYMFLVGSADLTHRFQISSTPYGSSIITGNHGAKVDKQGAIKFIDNNHLYILHHGNLFDGQGKLVK